MSGSESGDEFVEDQKELYEKKQRKKNQTYSLSPSPSSSKMKGVSTSELRREGSFSKFSEDLPVEVGKRTWYKLSPGERFIDALRKMDPDLVSKAKSDHGILASHTVLEGEIGKALHNGRTKFYGPGNYAALGVGKKWLGTEKLRKDGTDMTVHQDVTLLSLTENEIAVVQIGKTQYPIGSGQYIIRHPTVLEGSAIDVQKLGQRHATTVITEGTKQVTDTKSGKIKTEYTQGQKEITAGWTARAGAITLVRPEPGFRYVIQQAEGYRTGSEYTYARGEETFLQFINFLQLSRTTKRFNFFSLDRQRAEMIVQLTWVMEDAVKWLTRGRGYDDPFDFLEEKTEALFRDAIGSMDYKKALKEKSDGYDSMEKEIFKSLSNAASSLGAKLKSIEVRELSFPNLEEQEIQLAVKEAETRAKKLEAQRTLELRKIEDARLAAEEAAKQNRENVAAMARAAKMKIDDERALAQVQAENAQQLAKMMGKVEAEKARLKADQEVAALKAETAKIVATGEVEAELIRERGDITLKLERAKADAEAAKMMGDAIANSPGLLELKKMEILAEMEKERFKTLALFAKNPSALLPEALTRDLLRMRNGAAPQEFLSPYHPEPPTINPGSSNTSTKK